jgi:hypothetical protein
MLPVQIRISGIMAFEDNATRIGPNAAMHRTTGSLGSSTSHEIPSSTRSDTPPRQPSLILYIVRCMSAAVERLTLHGICPHLETIVAACLILLGSESVDAQLPTKDTPSPPPTRLESPNRQYVIEMRDNDDASANYDNEQILVISRNGKQVASQKTFGYLSGDASWNESVTLVAINNRRGNSGDYVWIFSLPDGRCLKSADSAQFNFIEEAADKAFRNLDKRAAAKDWDKEWIYAGQWVGDGKTLLINLSRRYFFTLKEPNFPSFDFDALVRVSGSRFELVWGAGRKTARSGQ